MLPDTLPQPTAPATPPSGVAPEPTTPPTPTQTGVAPAQPTAPATPGGDGAVEAERQKWSNDLNRMKASFQGQMSQMQRQWQDREAQWQERVRQAEMRGMDDDQRQAYEAAVASEELETLRQQNVYLQNQMSDWQRINEYAAYFQGVGVPAARLDFSQGVEGLLQSGWDAVNELVSSKSAANPTAPAPTRPAPTAPQVVTQTAPGPSVSGTTWAALRAKYGDDETVYRLVEMGQLPPSVIPQPGAG